MHKRRPRSFYLIPIGGSRENGRHEVLPTPGPSREYRLLSALLLARQHGVRESVQDLQRVLELNRNLGAIFDKAVSYATRGYTGADFPTENALLHA